MQFRGHLSIDHPIGMDYDRYANKSPATYVTPTHMDKRIVLEDGKVTCVSCHQTIVEQNAGSDDIATPTGDQHCNAASGYTTGPSQVQLCMGCHAM